MTDEVVSFMAPRTGSVYCDATVGAGGHALAILEASAPEGVLIGIDRDKDALESAAGRLSGYGSRLRLVHGRFSMFCEILSSMNIDRVDGILLDLGISSMQVDRAERGFSFQKEGPVDMRMDTSQSTTAVDLIANLSERELASILYRYSEEKGSRKVAKALKDSGRKGELKSTLDLAAAVHRVLGKRSGARIDSATRTFQALRMAVNDEIGELEKVMDMLPEPLSDNGSVVVISFHSLEDRIVKNRFNELSRECRCPAARLECSCEGALMEKLTKKVIRPTESEIDKNPRARSARLRAARRIIPRSMSEKGGSRNES